MDQKKQEYQLSDIEKKTGTIYDNLFAGYDKKLFEESVELFSMRHKKWGFDLDWFKGKTCLDAGCGGGRFVLAIAKLGAKKVHGIDIAKGALKLAKERCDERGVYNVKFEHASVVDIPFPDNYFDYVLSSGVILLADNPYGAFLELKRVLKPGGKLFLSVYGKRGLKWLFKVDIWRYTICKIIPFRAGEKILKFLGVPANNRYAILDNVYTPHTKRFTEKEIMGWFKNNKFKNMDRVKFERYDYEKWYNKIIFGEGWIQIYANKE